MLCFWERWFDELKGSSVTNHLWFWGGGTIRSVNKMGSFSSFLLVSPSPRVCHSTWKALMSLINCMLAPPSAYSFHLAQPYHHPLTSPAGFIFWGCCKNVKWKEREAFTTVCSNLFSLASCSKEGKRKISRSWGRQFQYLGPRCWDRM